MYTDLGGNGLLRRSFFALSALVVALALAALAAGQARAAFPGMNGKLVFETNRDGNEEIYTMNSDGTNRVDLTRNPADDTDPRWSSDGSRIVFASNRTGNYQIYTMNADGSGVARVTHDANDDRRPTWTADGHILFQNGTFPNRAIFRINADGNGLQQLTPVSSDNATVAAAPRGGRIAFSSTRGDGTQRLYTANADGSAATEISTPRIPYLDTFSDDRIDPFWFGPTIVWSSPTVSETNGRLEVSIPSDTLNDPSHGFADAGINTQCHLLGDFDAQVDYQLLQWP